MKVAQIILLLITSINLCMAQPGPELLDKRDGKTYKTVHIDGQLWMAENLDYAARGTFCYDNRPENCEKYGRIYLWSQAMAGQTEEGAQGACPEGWMVPTDADWQRLETAHKRAKELVAGGTSGLNILFGGSRFTEGSYGFLEQCATFWTSTEDSENSNFAWTRYIYNDKLYKSAASYSTNKLYGQSLRCIKAK
jgi:uncharacterized protein (TIGR02145 family)